MTYATGEEPGRRPSSLHGGATGTYGLHNGIIASGDGYTRRYDEIGALVTRPSAWTTRYYGQIRSRRATSRISHDWIYVGGMESSSTQRSSSSAYPQWTL